MVQKRNTGMLRVLEPLHELLEEGAKKLNEGATEGGTTLKEKAFNQAYGRELQEAYECCMNYKRTGKVVELTQVRHLTGLEEWNYWGLSWMGLLPWQCF
ncbi:hypothetical protein HHK36_019099 [Tetracentron sinense]|uniref:FKBP12-rapamycin binding domain-containing protein n=1 Tax=Tetracentron sinense TaxID=13715 RepID=A0A835D9A1_TETSI|nr:hypothetical protein HHK36_019099 [Tetracentron sinense]